MLFGIVLIVCCALALMALEAFIPGISFAGIAGVILFGVAAYLCWNAYGMTAAILFLVVCALLSFLSTRLVFRSMKSGKLSKSGMFMNEPVLPAVKTAAYEGQIEQGSVGVARTPLHPAGIVELDGLRIHVVSESGFVEKDEPVIVVRTEGARIVVKRIEK